MYTFNPNESFFQLLNMLPKNFIVLKTFDSELSCTGITTTDVFRKYLDKSKRKLNKMWVDKCSGVYNRSMT